MVPTWTGKPWEKSQSGKSQENLNRLEKSVILASFYFYFSITFYLIKVYLLSRFLYLLNSLNKTPKNTGKWKKVLENVGMVNTILVGIF